MVYLTYEHGSDLQTIRWHLPFTDKSFKLSSKHCLENQIFFYFYNSKNILSCFQSLGFDVSG